VTLVWTSRRYVQEVVTVTAYFILKCTKVTSRLGWQLVHLYFFPMMTGIEHNTHNFSSYLTEYSLHTS